MKFKFIISTNTSPEKNYLDLIFTPVLVILLSFIKIHLIKFWLTLIAIFNYWSPAPTVLIQVVQCPPDLQPPHLIISINFKFNNNPLKMLSKVQFQEFHRVLFVYVHLDNLKQFTFMWKISKLCMIFESNRPFFLRYRSRE